MSATTPPESPTPVHVGIDVSKATLNRLDGVVDKLTIAMIRKVIRLLAKRREELDCQIAGLIEADNDWRNKRDLVQSVPARTRRAPTP